MKIGDLVEVVSDDHTTDDKMGWLDLDEINERELGPSPISTVGYFVGKNKKCWIFAMGYCDGAYTGFWFVPRNKFTKFKVLKRR